MFKMAEKLSYRIAEEAQLLAEEKWLITALENIKKERNCLQIERLHLDSLKAKLIWPGRGPNPPNEPVSPSTLSEPLPQNVRQFSTIAELRTDTNEPQSEDTSCNIEKLDLTVSKSVFDQVKNPEFCAEEDEDDNTDDEVLLDMDILMSGDGGNASLV